MRDFVGDRFVGSHAGETFLTLAQAAHRVALEPAELRRRLTAQQIIRLGRWFASLRMSDLVALRRAEEGASTAAVYPQHGA